MVTDRPRPEGPVQMCGETMPRDGLVRVDYVYGAGPEVKDTKVGRNWTDADVNSPRNMTVITDRHATPSATCLGMEGNPPPTPALRTNDTHPAHLTLSASVFAPLQKGIWTPATSQKIFIQTPTGECVPGHEVQWELHPFASVCGDTSKLMEIIPGHHNFQASATGMEFCTLIETDLRSQFYRTPPIRESSPTLEPSWSQGTRKSRNNQARLASRRQAPEASEIARNVSINSLATTSTSTPSQNLGGPNKNDDIHREVRAQRLTHEATAVPLQDDNLFYKNGKPKPPPSGRLFIRVLTSKARKRPGGRNKDRRRNRNCGSPAEVPKEFNPETVEQTKKGDEPIQTLNPTRDRMLLFLFIKYAVGLQNKGSYTEPIHKTNHFGEARPEPPTQRRAKSPREHPVEQETDIGAACFEPNTSLLLQDPLNHATYDPGKTLSRSIGSLKYGDTVLAEKHGPDGRGNFSLAKITCVMTFEIPQVEDPVANKIIQENNLSTGLGFTLTKHHHIRKHGQIRLNARGRRQLTNLAGDLEWKVAADLAQYTIPLLQFPHNTSYKGVQPLSRPTGQCSHPNAQQ